MANCKNCNSTISEEDNYCNECGAKIIKERITLKSLFSHLLVALGWDSNFVVTLRYLIYKPQVVIQEYINGTRKKFANPFSLFAIITAVSIFIFNQYSEEFIEMSSNPNLQQEEITQNHLSSDTKQNNFKAEFNKNQNELNDYYTPLVLKYYNLIAFLFLPLYTLISRLVFGKPYNFGEHLVTNTFLQSILAFLGILLFILSLLVDINIYFVGLSILPFFYYCLTYKKLYQLTFVQLFLRILKFVGVFLLLFLISVLIGFVSRITK
ncbi:DUF3667 domain-containing protein [Zobellia laminariae]|uniref:DUF3667 domain-containing protein n=1 Tax=Zobellia laminariae TaxID=248906 RepID=UPI0012D9DCB4|nr:DUF3667 domain-containing protein [Zobellia laminariae]